MFVRAGWEMKFLHIPRDGGGDSGGGKKAQNGPILTRKSPESTRNSPVLTQIGPSLARKSPGADHGWLGGAWGGDAVGDGLLVGGEIFGLLNFCCTRQACLI